MTNTPWWAIPAAVTSVAVLAYALVQLTVEPESVTKKKHAMHLLTEVQAISDAVVVKLHALDDDVVRLQKSSADDEGADTANDVPLNSYYHFDSTGKKLKTKWDSYDVDAELDKLDEEDAGNAARRPQVPSTKPRPSTAALLRKVGELEHEFEAILAYLDTIRGDEEVRIVRKQLVGAINDTYLATLDRIKSQLK